MKTRNVIIKLQVVAALSIMLGYGEGLKGATPMTNAVRRESEHRIAQSVDVSALEDDIRKFTEIMTNTNISTRGLWKLGTNILDRIVAEKDEDKYMEHFQKVEDAILGVKFKELPLSDSDDPYDEWERSISLFEGLSFMYSVSFWKKKKDIDHGREFDLKRLEVYRREIERIVDAKPKPLPKGFLGVHGSLERVRSKLMLDRKRLLRDFSHGSFGEYYIALPEPERARWEKRIEDASGLKFELDEIWKKRMHDEEVRKPRDGGDVLPHPFTFLGCTFGNVYEVSRRGGNDAIDDVILCWYSNFRIEPYFGKKWMTLRLAPRSKIAYSAEIEWSGYNTREELSAQAKEIKADIEKRLGVTLGDFFFESGGHVRDNEAWKNGGGLMRSLSVFGPIMIEISASDNPGSDKHVDLVITDKAAEALVEKERKENPLTFDSKAEKEAERRRFERLKELGRQRKAMKDVQKAGGAGIDGN